MLEKAKGYRWPAGFAKHADRYIRSVSTLQAFLKLLPRDRFTSAVQAGGHCGLWPLALAERFESVYTFEPDATNFAALMANVGSASNLYAARGFLGDGGVPRQLRVNERNSGGHWMRQTQGTVPVYRIDSLALPDCGAIVLDCEGGELSAICGAWDTLARCRPWLLLEMRGHIEKKTGDGTTGQLKALLRVNGYDRQRTIDHDEVWAPCSS